MDERSRAVWMLKAGKHNTMLQKYFMFFKSVISSLWNQYLKAGNYQRKTNRDVKDVHAHVRQSVRIVFDQCCQKAQFPLSKLMLSYMLNFRKQQVDGSSLLKLFIRNILHQANFKACRSAVSPVLEL